MEILRVSAINTVPVCQRCFIRFLLYFCLPKEWTAGWWWWAPLPCVCQWRCWEPCDPDHPSTQAHCNLTPAPSPPSSPLPTLTGPNDLTQTPVCLSWHCFYFFLSPASPPPASLSSFLSLCLFDSLGDAKGGELARKLRERKSELRNVHMCRLKTHGLYNEYLRKL